MKEFLGFRIYFGYPGWGWWMVGIGYKTTWFLGFSKNINETKGVING